MDRIKDPHILRLIEQISKHYQENISNRYLRPSLLQLQIDKNTWDQIELLTVKVDLFRYQGFHLDELYRQIACCARFVEAARNGMVPTLRSKISSAPSGPDRILREMAASNFVSNLKVFADLLNELYLNLVNMDKEYSRNQPPVYTQIQELIGIGRLLVGH